MNRYFNLNSEQKKWVQAKLKDLLSWHREQEIPKYIAILDELYVYARDGLSLDEVEAIWQKVEERREELIKKIIPDAAYFLSTLSTEQMDYFKTRALEDIEKLHEEESLPEEKKQKVRMRRYLEPYEDWYGSISREQKENLIFLAKKVPTFRDGLAEFRKKRILEFSEKLRSIKNNPIALEKLLAEYLLRPWENYPPERKALMEAFFKGVKRFIVAADELATPKQRAHFLENIEKWRNRLRDVWVN